MGRLTDAQIDEMLISSKRRPRHCGWMYSLSISVIEDMQREAKRLNRSLSWVARMSWMLARERLKSYPAPLK
jgi:uncharacterized small protein (TIGR04563 family)